MQHDGDFFCMIFLCSNHDGTTTSLVSEKIILRVPIARLPETYRTAVFQISLQSRVFKNPRHMPGLIEASFIK